MTKQSIFFNNSGGYATFENAVTKKKKSAVVASDDRKGGFCMVDPPLNIKKEEEVEEEVTEDLTSPLTRCMTEEEINLLSKNSTSTLEKDLIEYLKMQQQQQQQQQQHHQLQQQQQNFQQTQQQQQQHNHNNNVHLKPLFNSTHNHHHSSSMSPSKSPVPPPTLTLSKQTMQQQQHQQARDYQDLSNTHVAHNLSSPTDIANYMTGQNPMDPLKHHHQPQQHHPHFPLPISQIKKEIDYDNTGMCLKVCMHVHQSIVLSLVRMV